MWNDRKHRTTVQTNRQYQQEDIVGEQKHQREYIKKKRQMDERRPAV